MERNDDYSDTHDLGGGWMGEVGVITFFILEVPDYKSAMLIYYLYLYNRFSRSITSQLQNWAFLTYLHGNPGNTYIYSMQECQNVRNTSRHQEVVVSLLNLPATAIFCLENFKCSFWKIMIFTVVTLFFWRSDTHTQRERERERCNFSTKGGPEFSYTLFC